jgi:hypothetical protein
MDFFRIFTSSQRSFKLFRIVSKTGEYLKDNMRFQKFSGISFMPMVTSREEIGNITKGLFGLKGYSRFLFKYLYIKKFIYQNAIVPMKKVISIQKPGEVVSGMEKELPDFRNPPSFRYIDNKNILLDYSDIFKAVFPKNPKFLTRQQVLQESDLIYPEIMVRLGIEYEKPELFKYLSKFTSSLSRPVLSLRHKAVVIGVPVKGINPMIASMYLDINKKVPRNFRINPEDLFISSITRFIYSCYINEDSSDERKKYYIDAFNNHRVAFVFYNNNFAFTLDFTELRERKINRSAFYNLFKNRLVLLIRNNMGLASDNEIDQIITDDEEIEDKNLDSFTITVDGKDKKKIDSGIKEIIDDTSIKMASKITKEVRNSDILVNKSITNTDVIGTTNDILSMINKISDGKDLILYNDNIEPEEDIEEEKEEEEVVENDLSDIVAEEEKEEEEIPENEFIEEKEEKKEIIEETGDLTEQERREILDKLKIKQTPKKSPKELRRISLVKNKYKSILANEKQTVEELLNDVSTMSIDITVNDSPTVIDKSVTKCTYQDFERSYVKKTMQQDIFKVVKSFSNNDKSLPLHIINFKEVDTSDRFNLKKTMTFNLEDENQRRHTLKFDIPIPDDDGLLYLGGNKKVLKKQRIPKPVIKVAPDKVIINTYGNKCIIYRQGTILNRKIIVIKKLIENHLKENILNNDISYGNNLNSNKNYITTMEYDELASYYHKITMGPKGKRISFFFNQDELRKEINIKIPEYTITVNKLPIGINYEEKKVIDFDLRIKNNENNKEVNNIYSVGDIILQAIVDKGEIKDVIKIIHSIKAPKRRIYSRMELISAHIPIVAVLSALYGLSNVMKVNGLSYTFSPTPLKGDDRLTIKFKDGILYYPEYPMGNSLLFNGLTELLTEEYNISEFDEPTPYIDYLYKSFKSRNMFYGWTSFKETMISDIDREILRDFSLPTDFLELFLYANELLTDNSYIHETREENYRIRGYEIIAAALYKSIQDQYKLYKKKSSNARTPFSISQSDIINRLYQSQLLENYDTVNPINELKQKSVMTYKGNGVNGSKLQHGFTLERRAYGEDSIGIVAISTVEAGNTGITKQLATNPRIINTRGYTETIKDPSELKNLTASETMSPDELIFAEVGRHDSPNRIGFSSGQSKHMFGIKYNCLPFVGTGFEKTLAGHIGNTFAKKASMDGKVIEINEELGKITIEYKDSSKVVYDYGDNIVRNSNFFLKTEITPNVKVGDKVKENDIIAYSKEFFIKQGKDLIFSAGIMARVALMDNYFTEEDSSLMTSKTAEWLTNPVIKRRQIVLGPDSNIIKYVDVGDHVLQGDPLIIFEDQEDEEATTKVLDMLGDADTQAMEDLLSHSAKANGTGIITKIDLYWTIPIEQMSESCKDFVNHWIKEQKKAIKYEEETTGKPSKKRPLIEQSFIQYDKINGETLPENGGLLIEYFINHDSEFGVGDKISVYPSLKSVNAQVLYDEKLFPYTESGNIDVIASQLGMLNRQVNSTILVGSVGKLLYDRSIQIANEYLDE